MKIGIIGCGVVGGACKFGFEKLGHEVKVHDTKLNTKLEDILDTDICYVCVPTDKLPDGKADVSVVESVVAALDNFKYKGYVAVRSTIPPGTMDSLCLRMMHLDPYHVCFIPEFLRERCALSDFTENNRLLVVGVCGDMGVGHWNASMLGTISACFGTYPRQTQMMTARAAEILKYMHNSFNALRVVFANEFYEFCRAFDTKYNEVKKAFLITTGMPDQYLDVNDNMRGYVSKCWEKDVPAIVEVAKQLHIPVLILSAIEPANALYERTKL